MSSKDDFDVGYAKPPLHTRFVKGRSGNPRGRPKKVAGKSESVLEQVLARTARLRNPDGTEKKISWNEAITRKTLERAIKGRPQALRQLIKERTRLSRKAEAIQPAGKAAGRPAGLLLVPPIREIDEWEREAMLYQAWLVKETRGNG